MKIKAHAILRTSLAKTVENNCHTFLILGIVMKKRYYSSLFNHSIFACPWTVYQKFIVVIWYLFTFWGKKKKKKKQRKNAFFQDCFFDNQILNKFIVCMWTDKDTTLKNTLKVVIFEETEFKVYDFFKNCSFRKLQIVQSSQLRPKHTFLDVNH